MDEAKRQALYDAHDEIRRAQKAYDEEFDKYVSYGWTDAGPIKMPEKPITHEALDRLDDLRGKVQEAQDAYRRVAERWPLA